MCCWKSPSPPQRPRRRELFALADAKGLVLMEAITIPYLPQYAFLQAELPKIGEVRGAMASFCARQRPVR